MRSIKFKVWDTVDNEMTDWEEIRILPHEKLLIDVFEGDVERYKYLQFIGKKDSENKDLYTGQIVKVLYSDWISKSDSDTRSLDEYLESISKIGYVKFNERECCFGVCFFSKKFNEEYFGDINVGKYGIIKIIGTIYQNPELLERSAKADA